MIHGSAKCNATKSLLPHGWRMMRFDEIAENVAERVDPAEAAVEGLEYYVGLEHLDSESLKIRRWGTPDEVIGQKLRFRKGDIIFGRRRCYQRKLAVAEFDGICSAHAMVLRAKEDAVEKDFLPFFLQSDMFMERALAISVGSLSPTINWRTLKVQEFPLPPRDEQRRIAEILWAAEEAIRKATELHANTQRVWKTFIEHELDALRTREEIPLRNLWTRSPKGGYSPPAAGTDTGHYVLTLSALSNVGYQRGNLKPVELDKRVEDSRLRRGDLLISRSNTIEFVGLVGIFDEERADVSFSDLMMRIDVDERRVDKHYLELLLLSRRGRAHMRRVAAGTSGSMKKINRKGLGAFKVPLPALDTQQRIVGRVNLFKQAAKQIGFHRRSLEAVKTRLIGELIER